MSKKPRHHIKATDLPPTIPIRDALFWWMFLTYVNAPGWLFGAIGVVLLIVCCAQLDKMINSTGKSMFEKDGTP